ncbi:cofilin/actin-depolymerizing factor [Anaeramoeba ignava]|uniref:Cofilin/actin-depolymerizing factor n=1 Tax=Anaeramoeba ignava TaxID=1746090 RepID=A0A9Q0RFT1_ANAIG|nr:cofilin/actin-depolymerizing factor [Anaeramoeba ignava]
MDAGIRAEDECIKKFNEFKMGNQISYLIYRLSDDLKRIIIEKIGEKEEKFEDFVSNFIEKKSRYGVYCVNYELDDGSKRSKIVFFSWIPRGASIKEKMLFATSKSKFKRELVGLSVEIQATDESEITFENVIEKVTSKFK